MALTTNYSIAPLLDLTLPAADPASNSDTVGLSGGGFATVADDPSGFSQTTFYDAAGNPTKSPSLLISDSKIAQLTNGDVVFAGNHSGGGVNYDIETSDGGYYTGFVPSDARDSNADVAALAGGGFVVVYQRALDATHHNIVFDIRDSVGTLVTSRSLDTTADDVNASVAGLADGGFAVAFEETFAFGHTKAWEIVFNADGSNRGGGYFDDFGNVHHQLSVTALQTGGFAVGYQEDDRDGTQTDISVVTFDSIGSTGIPTHSVRASLLPTNDSEAAVTTLSNGLVMTTFTNDSSSGGRPDSDIRATLIDPTTGNPLTDTSNPLAIDGSGDLTSESSVSATGLAQFVVSYSNSTSGDVSQKTFQLVRTVTGDAGDNKFTGDDAVDIINGLGGNDTLGGGANNDTLNGGDGIDYLNGGAGNDILNSGANNDHLLGGAGNDTLKGGTGADAMLGGLGNDRYYVDNASDEVSEAAGGGFDRVFSSVSYILQAGQEIETLAITNSAGTGAINLTGNEFGQLLIGNAGNNVLRGNGGNDTLIGGAGLDKLIGGAGLDRLNGGAGNDSFIYSALGDSGTTSTTRDQIAGFASGDKIDVHVIDAIAGGGDNAFVLDADGSFSQGEISQTVTGGGDLRVNFNADADAAADMSILLVNHTTLLTSGDFVL